MMKKLISTLTFLLAFVWAHGQSLSSKWYYEASTGANELLTTTNNTYSLAYNKSTGHLLVANRGEEIYIINNPDGFSGNVSSIDKTTLPKLSKNLLPSGTINQQYCFSKVRVTDDGVIYATAMQTDGTIYIYRWANESATPTSIFFNSTSTGDTNLASKRVGESFGLFGTGENTYLYLPAAANSPFLFICKLDNAGVVNYYGSIDITSAKFNNSFMDVGKGSVSPEANNILWLGSTEGGVTFRRLKINLNTLQYVSHEVISSTYANFNCPVGEYIDENGKAFFFVHSGRSAANQNNNNLSSAGNVGDNTVTMANVASYTYSKSAYTTNSGYADIAFKKNNDNTTTFYLVTSRNYMASLKTNWVLPVSINSFEASLKNNQSTLSWQTGSESSSKAFEILHSTNGVDFNKIGTLNSKAINGNSSSTLNYSFIDRNASKGVNYYKLQQVDLSGASTIYDKIVQVYLDFSSQNFVLSPNPADNFIQINANQSIIEGIVYEIYDINGRKIKTEQAVSVQQKIDVSQLPAAIYYLRVVKDGSSQESLKFVKK